MGEADRGSRGVWAIVPAAGSGTRFGGAKQYRRVGGTTLLARAVGALAGHVEGIVVALPPGDDVELPRGVLRVAGGSTRLGSVRSALAAVPSRASIVVVHGPSHPLADGALTAAVIGAVRAGADAAAPGLPVVDAVKRVGADGAVEGSVDKTGFVVVQTPQAFRAAVLRAVHAGDPEAAEDTELVERAGGRVVIVPGDPANLHVATPADLALIERLAGAP